MEVVSAELNERLVLMCEMMTGPLERFLKCLSSSFVLINPMLCFKSSNEIVLDVGLDVFTEYVGGRTGMLNLVSMECFCFGISGNFMYRNGWFVSDVSSDIFVTLISASSVVGSGNLSFFLRLMCQVLDVCESKSIKFDAKTLYTVTRYMLPSPLLSCFVGVSSFEIIS